ncbi:astacin (Peptidase family m12A) domain-containing protein [Ditylenchus destructor]|nr:astacin (Peptidase family m12A) domain-containing protein [Ditylenchus destructor]
MLGCGDCQGLFEGLGQLGQGLGLNFGQGGQQNQERQNWGQQNSPPPPPGASNRPLGNLRNGNIPVENLGQNLGKTIDGVASQFFAPNPDSPIPPHVQRRIMRFCSRHPQHPRCAGHPEWQIGNGKIPDAPEIGGQGGEEGTDLNEMFPNWIPFKIPPIPRTVFKDFLAGVPQGLQSLIPAPILGQLNEMARRTLETTCAGDRCKTQKPEILNQRANLAEHEGIVQRLLNPGRTGEQLDHDVELRLARTHQVKKALLSKAGLGDKVEPANDGVFQKDILLTEQQSNTMLNEINAGGVGGRRKRSALFLEQAPTQRWPQGQPILYYLDTALEQVEKNAIEAAVQEIQSKTCVRFQKASQKPSGNYIYYIKYPSPTFCGLSYIGRVDPANPVYLSFLCGNPTGIAIHETLHALGLNHEQLRGDRDDFVKINWENVNAQNYDFFAIADAKLFTSYGVKYDYGSIMHYSSTIASQYPNKPTMTAKANPGSNNPLMGQRYGMAPSDIELVKKLYCMPGCEDKNVYCGSWATRSLCNTPAQKGWMVQNCRKSCGFCGSGK